MPNFLKSLIVPNANRSIEFAIPDAHGGKNVINVICGPNASGKSFMLRVIEAHMSGKTASKTYPHWEVVPTAPGPIKFFRAQHFQKNRSSAGILAKHWYDGEGAIQTRNNPNDFRSIGIHFFRELLSGSTSAAPSAGSIDKKRWESEPAYIKGVVGAIPLDEFRLYPYDGNDPFMRMLQDILHGTICFRNVVTGGVEVALITDEGNTLPYSEWSDGQKSVFFALLVVNYRKPDVLLIDEIENFLHPSYMSRTMSYLAASVPQSIITTHHPHIIFSDHVDRAFYIEKSPPKGAREAVVRHVKASHQAAPARTITTLEDGFAKFAAVYKLFDVNDAQLLKQASRVDLFCEIDFRNAVLKCFEFDVLPGKVGGGADRQTLDLSSLIQKDGQGGVVRVLDWGAGKGRTISEFAKISSWKFPTSMEWSCYEAFEKLRLELQHNLDVQRIGAKIVSDMADVPDESQNVALLANVLHELNPDIAAQAISQCAQKLELGGALAVCEIYPLLHAERPAVPYTEDDMLRLLRACGFDASAVRFSVYGSTAYCVRAVLRRKDLAMDASHVRSAIEKLWQEIELRCLSSFRGGTRPSNYEQFRNYLQDLTAVSSIRAWMTEQRW